MSRFSRPRRSLLAPVVLAILLALPAGIVLASHQFSDVPDSNIFHADIDAVADAGVTTGCAAGKYCPNDNVTRGQMAAFMNRLGALGPGKTPVVNADRLDGLHADQMVRAATATAGNLENPCYSPPVFDDFSAITFTTAVARNVTAPTDGILLLFGVVSAERDLSSVGDLRLLARLSVDGVQVGPVIENSYDDAVTIPCQEGRSLALSGAYPLTAGDHDVAVQIRTEEGIGTGTAWVGNASVTTLFVPFGNDGTLALSESIEHVPGLAGADNR